MALESVVMAGLPPIITLVDGGSQPVRAGTQGPGPTGVIMDLHVPNGFTFRIGTKSRAVDAGWPLTVTVPIDVNGVGIAPIVHISMQLLVTRSPMIVLPASNLT